MSGTQALLSEYAHGGSERAFRELVTCYINFVFSTALRIVGGDRALAEDIAQTVFTDLARKAASLPKDVRLGGWLHRHTCFVARKALRRERRRIAREKQAVEFHGIEDYSESNLAQLALVLDQAINDLGEEDRNAIVLRFFEELDFRSIGEALGSSEDAARMRVSRAVEKMGRLLKRRGLVLTAAGISFALSGKLATAAPMGLATRIIYVELARPAKAPGILRIIKEACFTRLNIGIVSAAVILGLLVLFLSARRTGAKALPDPGGQTFTPAEFADLAVEETDSQNAPDGEVAPPAPEISPAPNVVPAAAVAAPKPVVKVKPVVINVPRAQAQSMAGQSTTASVPMDNGDSAGRPVAIMQGNQRANSWPQRPGTYVPPRVAPQVPSARATTNSGNAQVLRNPPNPNMDVQPWSQIRTMATMEPGTLPPNPAASQSSVQSLRSAQRSAPTSRSNDPRRRDRQP